MPSKLVVLHYNILEKYPPAMNFIRDLERSKIKIKILIISSRNITTYRSFYTFNGSIVRFGTICQTSFRRYISYLIYNIGSLIWLIRFKPQSIVVFETLSIWPAYFYKKINKKVNVHVHHHEYVSPEEMELSSPYIKLLHNKEKQLFNLATFSQTNDDRKELYLKVHPSLNSSKVKVYPNLPPRSWWNEYGSKKVSWLGPKIKLVYVGALDLETMYVKEVVEWVLSNTDLLDLTIISHQMNTETFSFLQSVKSNQIKIIEPINYEYLPNELIKYDIGLVLYKGHVMNYCYNVPNKVFEYLYCGLRTLGDSCMVSTEKLNLDAIKLVKFNSLRISRSELFSLMSTRIQIEFVNEPLSGAYL